MAPGEDSRPPITAQEDARVRALLRGLRHAPLLTQVVVETLDRLWRRPPERATAIETAMLLAALEAPGPGRWRERAVAAWLLGRVALQAEERRTAATRLAETLERPLS